MSVTLFEPALASLLDSETGPVGLFVRHRTETIRDEVGGAAADYFRSSPELAPEMDSDVSVEMEGSTGVIAINPSASGHKWGRLIDMTTSGSWDRWNEIKQRNNLA